MTKISAVILSKNESSNIQKCIRSISFCNEIILVDDYSTDETVRIARKFKVIIVQRKLANNFAEQRNAAIKYATNEWLLYVDADEVVSKKLAKEIVRCVNSDKFKSYKIKRKNIFIGEKMNGGEWGNNEIIRLVKKGTGKWVRAVHEYWKTNEEVGKLTSILYHHSPSSISKMLEKLVLFTKLHSKENESEGKKASISKVLFMPFGKFIYNYFLRKGYKDGTRGFIMSIFMSFHSFISWSQLWLAKK